MGGGHHAGNPGGVPGGGPGTPIISSPQDATNGGDGNYMMKNVQGGMQVSDQSKWSIPTYQSYPPTSNPLCLLVQ